MGLIRRKKVEKTQILKEDIPEPPQKFPQYPKVEVEKEPVQEKVGTQEYISPEEAAQEIVKIGNEYGDVELYVELLSCWIRRYIRETNK